MDDNVDGAIPELVVLAGARKHRCLEGKASQKAASFPTVSASVPVSRFLPPLLIVGSFDTGLWPISRTNLFLSKLFLMILFFTETE